MSNHITASVEFYYKGEKLTSSVELDLDKHMQNTGSLPALYPLLAQAINLDFYSYEYEMMQAETIIFNNARGLVVEHVNEGIFDFESFESAWAEAQTLQKLQEIVQRNLSVNDIQQRPELKNALLEAYQLGVDTTQRKK
ncbi:MAG: hypothetical protein BMS9Abin19_0278 [Gammaproteobacteria bacterium]|nr:MAG: hypothetical protein BMS9Abin19_0278 [Gammaproteobacteria bacterium]